VCLPTHRDQCSGDHQGDEVKAEAPLPTLKSMPLEGEATEVEVDEEGNEKKRHHTEDRDAPVGQRLARSRRLFRDGHRDSNEGSSDDRLHRIPRSGLDHEGIESVADAVSRAVARDWRDSAEVSSESRNPLHPPLLFHVLIIAGRRGQMKHRARRQRARVGKRTLNEPPDTGGSALES